ncbi:MAG TPA: type II CAAX endopeptidase family protein [Acidimicrobiales bacterium]|nr:type II CAAX endopeptidase family protein [Acidimicrobiales bacterium]
MASLVFGGLLAAVGAHFSGTNGALTQVLGEIGLWTGMIGTVLLVLRRYATGSLVRDLGLRAEPLDVLWGLVAAGCALVLSLVVAGAFAHTRYAGSNTAILSHQKGHDLGLVVVSLLVSLGAPFFEEIFFRGYLRKSFEPALGANGAVLAQAACFALAHLGEVQGWGNVSVLAALFVVGAVLGFTAKMTGRLAGGMVAHGLFNLVAVLTVV